MYASGCGCPQSVLRDRMRLSHPLTSFYRSPVHHHQFQRYSYIYSVAFSTTVVCSLQLTEEAVDS